MEETKISRLTLISFPDIWYSMWFCIPAVYISMAFSIITGTSEANHSFLLNNTIDFNIKLCLHPSQCHWISKLKVNFTRLFRRISNIFLPWILLPKDHRSAKVFSVSCLCCNMICKRFQQISFVKKRYLGAPGSNSWI